MLSNNWRIDQDTTNDLSNDLESILSFLLDGFNQIFGVEIMNGEKCIVYNDPKAQSPKLIYSLPSRKIRLNVNALNLWCQVIYQLGHEMCHYALHQHKKDDKNTLYWFEEIVSEAVSLYILKYAKDNWGKCSLSKRDPNYRVAIARYLVDEKKKSGNPVLVNIHSFEELERFNAQCEKRREDHREERNTLYEVIKLHPNELKCLVDYSSYLVAPTQLLVDFPKWRQDNSSLQNNTVLQKLESFQPLIK